MTRFWTLVAGLACFLFTVRTFAPGGIDQRELTLLLTIVALLGIAMGIEGVIASTEARHKADLRQPPQPEPEPEAVDHELRYTGTTEDGREIVALRPAGRPSFVATPPGPHEHSELHRTWEPRPDQALPPAHPSEARQFIDSVPQEPGFACRVGCLDSFATMKERLDHETQAPHGSAERIRQARERGEQG